MQQHLPGALHSLEGPLNHYGYALVAGAIFLEDFGLPLPGETILVLGAVYAGSGRLSIVWVVALGIVAAIVGDNVGYIIGRKAGVPLLERYGKYVLLTEHRLAKVGDYFDRHGAKIVVVARFIEGLRQANGIMAGATEMRWRSFVVANAIGAVLWVCAWSAIGYFAGNHIDAVYRWAERFSIGLAVIAALVIVYFVIRAVRKHRAGHAADVDVEPAGHEHDWIEAVELIEDGVARIDEVSPGSAERSDPAESAE